MSGVNDDCYIHYYIITKHLNCLGDILVYSCSCVETMAVGLLRLTQGGSKVRRHCQSQIVGGAFIRVTSNRQEAERTAWFEKSRYYFKGLNKNHWVDFYDYRVNVYTHFQHTFYMFKQHVKVNLASDDPFKKGKLRLGTAARV